MYEIYMYNVNTNFFENTHFVCVPCLGVIITVVNDD